MKIAMVNVVCGVKSTGRICTDLADELINNGDVVRIIYGRDIVPEQYKDIAIRVGNNLDVYFHTLKSRLFDSCGFESRKFTKRLIDWLKNYDPDIIHLHNLHGYYINLEILFEYLKTCNKKIIWTLHDCWAFTGHCSHFSEVNCRQWKTGCVDCRQMHGYPKCILGGNVKENYLKKKKIFSNIPNMILVTPSFWLAKQVSQSFLKNYPVKVIPNGIDLNVFKPEKSDFREKNNLESKKIVLGVATAWSDKKGLTVFYELAEVLGGDYKVVLVGLTKNQLKNLPENILGIGRTDSITELAEIYSAADVFVNAGKEETMGLTTVEAMACGTPVAVSNLTAVPEVVTEDGGIVFKQYTASSIKRSIEEVIGNQYFDTRKNALLYEKKKQYKEYLKLYKP